MAEAFKDLVARAHGMRATAALPVDDEAKVHPLYVLPKHEEWMSRPERERCWSESALAFNNDVMRGKFKHERSARISPSAMGAECERQLLFGYAGAPRLPFPKANAEKAMAGDFHHLRWQMMGLSAGWMAEPEMWLHAEALRCGGSADGALADFSLFELKSTAPHLFKCAREMVKAPKDRKTENLTAWDYFVGMHRKHLLQMEAYWLVDEVGSAERGEPRKLSDWGSLIYMDTGAPANLVEFRLHSSPGRRKQVNAILESLHDWIDLDQLPDMLEGCRRAVEREPVTDDQLKVYNGCDYREFCPSATRVSLE